MRTLRFASFFLTFVLTACADSSLQKSDQAFLAHTDLVGLSKQQIIACAGQPQRTEQVGGREELSYSASSGATTPLLSKEPHSCEVVFAFRQGYVEEVRYVGARTGGLLTPGEECAPIVQKCVGISSQPAK